MLSCYQLQVFSKFIHINVTFRVKISKPKYFYSQLYYFLKLDRFRFNLHLKYVLLLLDMSYIL